MQVAFDELTKVAAIYVFIKSTQALKREKGNQQWISEGHKYKYRNTHTNTKHKYKYRNTNTKTSQQGEKVDRPKKITVIIQNMQIIF